MNKSKPTENELFDKFWEKYPRKEGKPKALKTFEKYCKTAETLEQVLAELERQSKFKDWKHTDIKYIPLAQTWLNRKDWEENQNGISESENTARPEHTHRYGCWI